jgi:hypothetical protein
LAFGIAQRYATEKSGLRMIGQSSPWRRFQDARFGVSACGGVGFEAQEETKLVPADRGARSEGPTCVQAFQNTRGRTHSGIGQARHYNLLKPNLCRFRMHFGYCSLMVNVHF